VDDYESGISRLIERVRRMNKGHGGGTLSKEILQFASRLKGLVDDLDSLGSAQEDIECEHDKDPAPEIGNDGYPRPVTVWGCSYKATLMHMSALADSAKRAADSLPTARQKLALPFAALGVLHLRYRYEYPAPKLSDNSPDVLELKRVCEAAGMFKSNETLRNALSAAMISFDRYYFSPGIDEVLGQG
jgi:hypothetical protein